MSAPTSHHRKPVPDEPWRYVCPYCESVSVIANASNGKPRSQGARAYRCQQCSHTFDGPADRKGGDGS